jgi:hypothetical protein
MTKLKKSFNPTRFDCYQTVKLKSQQYRCAFNPTMIRLLPSRNLGFLEQNNEKGAQNGSRSGRNRIYSYKFETLPNNVAVPSWSGRNLVTVTLPNFVDNP